MSEQARTEYGVELVRRVVHYVSFQRGKERLHKEKHDHTATDNRQRRNAVVADNFVDDNLRYERKADAHKLQEKHCYQHFNEWLFVMQDNLHKPVYVVAFLDIVPAEGGGKDKKLVCPTFLEFFDGNGLRSVFARVNRQDDFVIRAAYGNVGSVNHFGD